MFTSFEVFVLQTMVACEEFPGTHTHSQKHLHTQMKIDSGLPDPKNKKGQNWPKDRKSVV